MSLLLHYNNTINYSNCELLYLYIHIPLSFTNIFHLLEEKKIKSCLNKASSDSLINNISNMKGVKITLVCVKYMSSEIFNRVEMENLSNHLKIISL